MFIFNFQNSYMSLKAHTTVDSFLLLQQLMKKERKLRKFINIKVSVKKQFYLEIQK